MDILTKRIRELRKLKKISQKDLGKSLGLGNSTISNYESGYSSPDNETLSKIADVLEATTDYLLGKTDIPNLIVRENKNAKFHVLNGHENNYTEEDLEMALKIIDMMKKGKKDGKFD